MFDFVFTYFYDATLCGKLLGTEKKESAAFHSSASTSLLKLLHPVQRCLFFASSRRTLFHFIKELTSLWLLRSHFVHKTSSSFRSQPRTYSKNNSLSMKYEIGFSVHALNYCFYRGSVNMICHLPLQPHGTVHNLKLKS